MSGQTILLTGGNGYIGSHCYIEIYKYLKSQSNEYKILIVDNFYNSSKDQPQKIKQVLQITHQNAETPELVELNICDTQDMEKLFQRKIDEQYPIKSVIHFAALKAVGESVAFPLKYYQNNVQGTINLLNTMIKFNCKNFIFSSSATVYGTNPYSDENTPLSANCPYGQTKIMCEQIMKDVAIAHKDMCLISLRYYNPCGAHESGLIGDRPLQPQNLFPYIEQVVLGLKENLRVFGNDYQTVDGTGVRDYIHVVDLAKGHTAALKKFEQNLTGFLTYNLGTGKGNSVLEVLKMYSKVIGREVPYIFADRRPGDVPVAVAIVDKANKELEWQTEWDLEKMCQDSYNFIQKSQ